MTDLVDEWNSRIKTWMIDTKQATVAALAHINDGAVFAGAAADGDALEQVYKPSYEAMLPQEDGTDKATLMNEPEILKFAAENLRAPNGLWIAGQKYKVVRVEPACEHGKHTFKTMFCAKPKGGLYAIITAKGLIVLAIYNEDIGQNSINCKTAALNFAEYLADHDY